MSTLLDDSAVAAVDRSGSLPLSPRLSPRGTGTARRRTLVRAGELLLVVALGALVAVTHGRALLAGPGFGDDEGTYTAQAWAVEHLGTLAHYTYWYDHPPLGWLLIAAWDTTFGRLLHPLSAVEGGRQFMVVVAVASALLLYAVGRRLGLHRWACTAAVVAWALSPLALTYSRMVFLDNTGTMLLLAALLCALSSRRHLWAYACAGVLVAAAVLTKETLLLSAPAIGYAVYRRSAGRTRPFCVAAFLGSAALVVALYPLLATLKGELLPGANHVSLVDALRFQLVGRQSTGSPLDPGSGSAAQVRHWLALDPYLLVAGVVLAVPAVLVGRLRPVGLALLVPVVVSLRPGYLPDPFVIALLPFAALTVAGVLDLAVGQAGERLGARLAGLPADTRRRRALGGSGLLLPRSVPAGSARRSLAPATRALPLLVAGALAVGVLAAGTAVAAPRWRSTDAALYADTSNRAIVGTEDWIGANVPHRARVLVDDTMWVDLVRRGFDPHLGVLWFYKTDFTNNLDPSVARALPDGYRDVQYVVVTPVMRSALAQLPTGLQQLRLAIRYSRPVHTAGTGDGLIEVRQILPPAPAATPAPVATR